MTRKIETDIFLSRKAIGVLATLLIVFSALAVIPLPASATNESTPTIIFSGNTLSSALPGTETANRIDNTTALSTASLARTAATTRTGYTFGGWSLAIGDAATTTITTATTADTTRTLHAVWNSTVAYNLNGATSGVPTGNASASTYRFGQFLTLPTVGTMVRSGFAFGGWMASSISTNRSTSYAAAADALGNATLYAAWIKTVTFNANTATNGAIPISQVHVAGGKNLRLPVLSEMTLRKPGYDFMGWSTSAAGSVISNSTSYVPLVAQQTLYAIWKVQSTKATGRVFFKPGKSGLRATQKLALRDLVDDLRGKTAIKISLAATRPSGASRSLGKSRNVAVVNYLRTLGIVATFERTNRVGKGNLSIAKQNNRVIFSVEWANPTS